MRRSCEFSGGTVLRFRHPSLGWLEFVLPSLERKKISGYFAQQEAAWQKSDEPMAL
jgi:hypothetical protein